MTGSQFLKEMVVSWGWPEKLVETNYLRGRDDFTSIIIYMPVLIERTPDTTDYCVMRLIDTTLHISIEPTIARSFDITTGFFRSVRS
jgi:hypothetical protein